MQAVTGACLLIRRSLYKSVGGLAEIYSTGNFEDVELCLKVLHHGNVIIYEPNAELYHYGSGSDNTATIKRNHSIFELRNKEVLVWDDWRHY